MVEAIPAVVAVPSMLLAWAAVLYQRRRAFAVWLGLKEEK